MMTVNNKVTLLALEQLWYYELTNANTWEQVEIIFCRSSKAFTVWFVDSPWLAAEKAFDQNSRKLKPGAWLFTA